MKKLIFKIIPAVLLFSFSEAMEIVSSDWSQEVLMYRNDCSGTPIKRLGMIKKVVNLDNGESIPFTRISDEFSLIQKLFFSIPIDGKEKMVIVPFMGTPDPSHKKTDSYRTIYLDEEVFVNIFIDLDNEMMSYRVFKDTTDSQAYPDSLRQKSRDDDEIKRRQLRALEKMFRISDDI